MHRQLHMGTASNPEPQGRASVLVVDDHEVLARLVSEILELNGYRTAAVNSAERALALRDVLAFDAIVTDQNRPGMKGDVFARKLRDRGYRKSIICITGNPQTICDRSAFDLVLLKTELFPQLLEQINSLLGPESV
jgi:CheY-like chemotaxis protein